MNAADFLEILKYVLPSVVMLGGVYMVIKTFLENENDRRKLEVNKALVFEQRKVSLPIRLQAYERLVLFLERISPSNLIMRVNKPGMTATQLKSELISTINDEYTHNLSQQIYVSIQSWTLLKAVKEELINVINTTYAQLDHQHATGLDLAKAIFEVIIRKDDVPTQKAVDFLKRELKIVFEQ